MTGPGLQSVIAALVVFGLLGALAWAAKRGAFASLQKRGPLAIETTMPLGERRSLVIVSVEGRRLLLGLTPMQISLVSELTPVAAAPGTSGSARPATGTRTFEQEVDARS